MGEEASERPDALVGTIVNGKYRVEAAIARGGMGRIYYATQVPLERPVALKVVQGDGDNEHESQFLKRFLQEASILAKLQHPNVVTLFDYGRIEGAAVEQYFIAMEFLAGETLAYRLKSRGRLGAAETLTLGRQIIRGLREAHKRGIIHRDLKPSNIIIIPEGEGGELVKLVDFGIGKVVGHSEDAQDLTQDGVFVGTPRYMAPEQFEGHAFPASDLYALGTILFQALAGRLPFLGANMADFMVAKLARAVPTIRDVAPDADIPDSLEALVYHLLARRPEDRPSMDALYQQLLLCEEDVFGAQALGSTGSGPHIRQAPSGPYGQRSMPPLSSPISAAAPPSSGTPLHPSSFDMPLRVPPTLITAIPNLAQLTPPPMASSARPPPVDATASRAPLVVGLLLGLVVVAGAGAGLAWKLREPPPVVTSVSADTATEAIPAVAPVSGTFTLTIESVPPGAAVTEGESVLGVTPLNIVIERASVASGARTFILKKDGFAPMIVEQGPSTDGGAFRTTAVVHGVSLVPVAPDASVAVKSRPVRPSGAAPVNSSTDIRLKR